MLTGAKLNDDAISGQGALGAEPADTDEFLVSDAGNRAQKSGLLLY